MFVLELLRREADLATFVQIGHERAVRLSRRRVERHADESEAVLRARRHGDAGKRHYEAEYAEWPGQVLEPQAEKVA